MGRRAVCEGGDMLINLFDREFRHAYCSVGWKRAEKFEYIYDQMHWEGITLFTNDSMFIPDLDSVTSSVKVGWLLEPRSIKGHLYNNIGKVEHKFDFILTHDEQLLKNSEKYKFAPVGGCWIERKNYDIYPKTKYTNILASNKNFAPGHKLRHQVIDNLKDDIDVFGRGYNPVEKKEEALRDYMFSINIENSSVKNYFTEKLLDCFAMGTVPVYWGCTNVGDFFDERGIIGISSVDDVKLIAPTFNEKLYQKMLPYIKNNFELFHQYEITEDWIYEKYFQKAGA